MARTYEALKMAEKTKVALQERTIDPAGQGGPVLSITPTVSQKENSPYACNDVFAHAWVRY